MLGHVCPKVKDRQDTTTGRTRTERRTDKQTARMPMKLEMPGPSPLQIVQICTDNVLDGDIYGSQHHNFQYLFCSIPCLCRDVLFPKGCRYNWQRLWI